MISCVCVYGEPVGEPTSSLARLWARQSLRYVVVAGTVALLYVGLMAAGVECGLHYMFAVLVAQGTTIMVAFPVYRVIVFRSGGDVRHDFARFLTVWSSGAIAGFVATPFLVEVLGMDPVGAQILAIVVVSVLSFLAHRYFSFSRTNVSGQSDPLGPR